MPGAILGEFPVLDGELTNVVTATTREVSDIASIPYEQFRKIADEHPAIVWRNLARILALRIRVCPGTSSRIAKLSEHESD